MPALTTKQLKALSAGITGRIYAPAGGANRRHASEIDNVHCFHSRTLTTLFLKGLLAPDAGG